jgi:hypothetical protein
LSNGAQDVEAQRLGRFSGHAYLSQTMTWEAFRLTSKSPSELMNVMSPAGVDALVREALMACWRSLPEDGRIMDAWRDRVNKMWARNMKVWTAIKKPAPQAFFVDLAPFDSDGHFRQACVMSWMMLPRAGGREFKDTFKIIREIFDRNVAAWETDHATFTGSPPKKKRPTAKTARAPKRTKKAKVAVKKKRK